MNYYELDFTPPYPCHKGDSIRCYKASDEKKETIFEIMIIKDMIARKAIIFKPECGGIGGVILE